MWITGDWDLRSYSNRDRSLTVAGQEKIEEESVLKESSETEVAERGCGFKKKICFVLF